MENYDEEMVEVASDLMIEFIGDINISYNEKPVNHLQITPTDTVNFTNILKNVRSKIKSYSKDSQKDYIISMNNEQLLFRIVEEYEDETNDEEKDETDEWTILC